MSLLVEMVVFAATAYLFILFIAWGTDKQRPRQRHKHWLTQLVAVAAAVWWLAAKGGYF